MGCDIHLYVERRVNGQWLTADRWERDEDDGAFRVAHAHRFYAGRNYNLFAILANVRNGRGFAGIKTGEGFASISEPRGLPADVSPEVAAAAHRWDGDAHSHSWQTVAELLAYDWTQATVLSGWLDAVTFAKWDGWIRNRGENPEGWVAAVGGGHVTHVTEDEMRTRIKEIAGNDHPARHLDAISEKLGGTYCHCEWVQFYYQCAAEFLAETMPKLWRLGAPEDVRIVYFFDN